MVDLIYSNINLSLLNDNSLLATDTAIANNTW